MIELGFFLTRLLLLYDARTVFSPLKSDVNMIFTYWVLLGPSSELHFATTHTKEISAPSFFLKIMMMCFLPHEVCC